ncbi:hypothetical protein B0H13DRAFT_1851035 [Mycena leptocephala]|nr:hypothetical protein B0H13DRAFT_1851035 [Mycena leptocephala]
MAGPDDMQLGGMWIQSITAQMNAHQHQLPDRTIHVRFAVPEIDEHRSFSPRLGSPPPPYMSTQDWERQSCEAFMDKNHLLVLAMETEIEKHIKIAARSELTSRLWCLFGVMAVVALIIARKMVPCSIAMAELLKNSTNRSSSSSRISYLGRTHRYQQTTPRAVLRTANTRKDIGRIGNVGPHHEDSKLIQNSGATRSDEDKGVGDVKTFCGNRKSNLSAKGGAVRQTFCTARDLVLLPVDCRELDRVPGKIKMYWPPSTRQPSRLRRIYGKIHCIARGRRKGGASKERIGFKEEKGTHLPLITNPSNYPSPLTALPSGLEESGTSVPPEEHLAWAGQRIVGYNVLADGARPGDEYNGSRDRQMGQGRAGRERDATWWWSAARERGA